MANKYHVPCQRRFSSVGCAGCPSKGGGVCDGQGYLLEGAAHPPLTVPAEPPRRVRVIVVIPANGEEFEANA